MTDETRIRPIDFQSVVRTLDVAEASVTFGDAVSVTLRERGERGDEKELTLTLSRENWIILMGAVGPYL